MERAVGGGRRRKVCKTQTPDWTLGSEITLYSMEMIKANWQFKKTDRGANRSKGSMNGARFPVTL